MNLSKKHLKIDKMKYYERIRIENFDNWSRGKWRDKDINSLYPYSLFKEIITNGKSKGVDH